MKKAKIEIAKNMKKANEPIEKIIEYKGLNTVEIEILQSFV